jgi:hypothetical protein
MTANHHGFPAGWVSPEAFEHAQRQAVAWELAQEGEAKAKAAREQAISDRIASRRAEGAAAVEDGDGKEPVRADGERF